jgi:hypothetical protein
MSAIMRSRNGVMVVSSRDRSRGRTALPSTKGYQEASGSATAPLSCGGAAPFNQSLWVACRPTNLVERTRWDRSSRMASRSAQGIFTLRSYRSGSHDVVIGTPERGMAVWNGADPADIGRIAPLTRFGGEPDRGQGRRTGQRRLRRPALVRTGRNTSGVSGRHGPIDRIGDTRRTTTRCPCRQRGHKRTGGTTEAVGPAAHAGSGSTAAPVIVSASGAGAGR